jgi:hypothetical protein
MFRQRLVKRPPQRLQPLAPILPQRIEAIDSQRRQDRADTVGQGDTLSRMSSSRSLDWRRASPAVSSGIGTIEQTRGSPRDQASSVRSRRSASMLSDLARSFFRSTATLDGWMTCTSMPCAFSQRANQKPPRHRRPSAADRLPQAPVSSPEEHSIGTFWEYSAGAHKRSSSRIRAAVMVPRLAPRSAARTNRVWLAGAARARRSVARC